MKIERAIIDNFKSIGHIDIDFRDKLTKKIRPVTAIFGDNGSGKTTVLQAIALVISLATRKTKSPGLFKWHGFISDRINSLGETKIQIFLQLDDDEVTAVHRLYKFWKDTQPSDFKKNKTVIPNKERNITLVYESGKVSAVGGLSNAVELLGRYYIGNLSNYDSNVRKYYEEVGDVFWFDQYRNLGSGSIRDIEEEQATYNWNAGVEGLRDFLIRWWTYHMSNSDTEHDFITKLESHFSRIFTGTKFAGIEPRPSESATSPEFYFMLSRANTRYDISEMSSGEQAVFSVLYEFVRLSICKSIVLIDELELHLHPPEQQMLYNSLEKIGLDCQYLITSHSSYLDSIIPDNRKVRLEGGRLCL